MVSHIRTSERVLFLTFDDGPTPQVTDTLLDLLEQFDAKATFFVIAKEATRHPEVIAKIIAAGHTLGNHSLQHENFQTLSRAEQANDVLQSQTTLSGLCQSPCKYFRAPQGKWTFSLISLLKQHALTGIHWSKDSNDFKTTSFEKLTRSLIDAEMKNGEILLFHDDSEKSINMLKTLLPHWQKQGFRFAAIEGYV
ncbi:polysaccharide deacetylase family protein [Thalassotalea agarivorans]